MIVKSSAFTTHKEKWSKFTKSSNFFAHGEPLYRRIGAYLGHTWSARGLHLGHTWGDALGGRGGPLGENGGEK